MKPEREIQLIEQLRSQGSVKAFSDLYDFYSPRLYAFCLRMSKSRESAEEIVEDTFVWLWRNRLSLPSQKTLSTILFLKTRHLLINLYRARLNSPEYEDYLACRDVAGSSSASDCMDYDDLLATITKALKQLPEKQREVIRMIKLEGRPTKEVSEKLGITEQTVHNQLSLGLKQVRRMLSDKGLAKGSSPRETLAVAMLMMLTI